MRYFLFSTLVFWVIFNNVQAQFQEDFSDFNHTSDPTWSGDTQKFVVTADQQLQLNDTGATGSAFISTASEAIESASWSFTVELDFNPSSSNYLQVYLVSNAADFTQISQGYFLKIGGTEDEISLYRQDNQTQVKIIDGADGLLNQSINHLRIAVTRDSGGNWIVSADHDLDSNFDLVGEVFDDQYPSSAYFGILCRYTSTRADKFFFDDISVTGNPYADHDPPEVVAIEVSDSESFTITFNESPDPLSAGNTAKYDLLDYGNPTSVIREDSLHWKLKMPTSVANGWDVSLVISGLSDLNGNLLSDTILFQYYYPEEISYRDLVINELLPDPEPPVALPGYEFIELYNRSQKVFKLSDWYLSDQTTDAFLPDLMIHPGQYLVLLPPGYEQGLAENAFVLTSWPSLNNSGDSILLLGPQHQLVDMVPFSNNWYQDAQKENGGWSLEQVNPDFNCTSISNWIASGDEAGGTPGRINNRFNSAPDLSGPEVKWIQTGLEMQVIIQLDDYVEFPSNLESVFTLDHNILPLAIHGLEQPGQYQLELNQPLPSGQPVTVKIDSLFDCNANKMIPYQSILWFDNQPPMLLDWMIYSDYQVLLNFNEPIILNQVTDLHGNSAYDLEMRSDLQLLLTYHQNFEADTGYDFALTHISDTLGNTSLDTVSSDFNYYSNLDSLQVTSANSIDLWFDQPVDQTSANDVHHYLLNNFLKPFLALPDNSDNRMVHLFFDTTFSENIRYQVFFDSIYNSSNQLMRLPAVSFFFDQKAPELLEAMVTSDTSVVLVYDEALSVFPAELTTNFELETIGSPRNAELFAPDRVLLTFDSIPPEQVLSLVISSIADLSGNVQKRNKKIRIENDNYPPKITSARMFSKQVLAIQFNEQPDSMSLQRQNFSWEAGIIPDSVHFSAAKNVLYLHFIQPFPEKDTLQLTIFHLADQAGHQHQEEVALYLSSVVPQLALLQPISQTGLMLWYSEKIKEESLVPANFTLNSLYQPRQVFFDVSDSAIVYLDFPDSVEFAGHNALAIRELSDCFENISAQGIFDFSYENPLKTVELFLPGELRLKYSPPVPVSTFDDLSKFSLESNGFLYYPVKMIQGEESGSARLFFNLQFEADEIYTIHQEPIRLDYESWIPGKEFEVTIDRKAPQITSLRVSPATIDLTFSEALDIKSAEALNHYVLDGSGNPVEILFQEKRVTLRYPVDFTIGIESTLKVFNIRDMHQNVISDTLLFFTYYPPYQVAPGDILITEIMVDPSPALLQPEHQYVEIYNNSKEEIELDPLRIGDRYNLVDLGAGILDPGSYLLLLPDDYFPLPDSGNFIKLATFPYFNLSGDSVKLLNKKGEFIDLVVYDGGFYHDPNQEGGVALERIDLFSLCDGAYNWTASRSETGGTPGYPNSVSGDSIAFDYSVSSVEIQDENKLIVHFSAPLDNFNFNAPRVIVPGLTIQNAGVENNNLIISFSDAITPGVQYALEIDDLSFCTGKAIHDVNIPFGLGATPSFNELLVTELMVKPGRLGLQQTEYVEIRNVSGKLLNLSGLILGDTRDETEIPICLLQPDSCLLLTSSGGKSFFELNNILAVPGWPGFNDQGTVEIKTEDGEMIFNLNYALDQLEPVEKHTGGWSMEMSDLNNPCHFVGNWMMSVDPSGGTPGRINSVKNANPDHKDPFVEKVLALTPQLLAISLSEKLKPDSNGKPDISINPMITISEIKYDYNNSIEVSLQESLVPAQLYSLVISAVKDCAGNYIESDSYDFYLPEAALPGDILINEILFEPFPGGSEFVEIYNVSPRHVDLFGWQISNTKTKSGHLITEHFILGPDQYLVLSTNKDRLFSDYPKGNQSAFLNYEMPAWNNDSDSVYLFDQAQQLIDFAYYSVDFHSPMLKNTAGVALERTSSESYALDGTSWHSAASTTGFATPGLKNSSVLQEVNLSGPLSVVPDVISPDLDGNQDYTSIHYTFERPGQKGTMLIVDARGRVVKRIFEHQTLSTSGDEKWEGQDESNQKVPWGYYLVWLEVYDRDGNKQLYREKIVVTGK